MSDSLDLHQISCSLGVGVVSDCVLPLLSHALQAICSFLVSLPLEAETYQGFICFEISFCHVSGRFCTTRTAAKCIDLYNICD